MGVKEMDNYDTDEEQKSEEIIEKKTSKTQTNSSKDTSKNPAKVKFEFGKAYRLNMDGSLTESEYEVERQQDQCVFFDVDCCTIKIPQGFVVPPDSEPSICVDFSNLKCIKTPIIGKARLPQCHPGEIKECDIVAGYELKVVGSVSYASSIPIYPINGICGTSSPSASCSGVVPVDKTIGYTCSPNPCPNNNCYTPVIIFIVDQPGLLCDDIYTIKLITLIFSNGNCI